MIWLGAGRLFSKMENVWMFDGHLNSDLMREYLHSLHVDGRPDCCTPTQMYTYSERI